MAYDPKTVVDRYQQMIDLPDGEPTDSLCALARASGSAVANDTLGCEPGGCGSCCVGVVEYVRQFAEQPAELETRSIELDDILTKAQKLTQD